ncbi:ABC transporter substrate-binding protein [Bordetella muralis]|uniref:ABC transporter substrate-binding protein n=1 Tax=Bordetella muralis TaxID=1649130 RepID=UPI0039EE0360
MFKQIKVLSFVAAMMLASTAGAQEELKIGGIGPLSGGGTAWGLALQRGIQIAFDEVNAAGGLKVGDKVYTPKLVMYDDKYTAAGGRLAADRLINADNVKFIIGPIGSPSVLSAVAVTNPAKVLLLSNGFSPTILKNESKSPYNFRAMNSTVEFGPPMVKWFHETHPEVKKVALIAPNDAVGQSVVPQLAEYYKANGIEVWTELYDRGAKEFTPLMARMIAQNVDALDLNSNAPGEAALLLKQARQSGFKKTIWQVGGPSVDEIVDIAGPLANGFISLNVFDFDSPDAKGFIEAYRKKYGDGVINAQAPGWYNAAKIMLEAIRRAGTTEVTAVRDSLEKLDDYDAGLFGPVRWGGMKDYGVEHQLLMKFWIVEVKDGKQVTIQALQPEKR